MCGIFGAVGLKSFGKKEVDFLADAFVVDQLRGMHGTGGFAVNRHTKRVVYGRKATNAQDFLRDEKASGPLQQAANSSTLFVGHNRFTTHGGDHDDHCHPFDYENLIGVHNGGIPATVLDRLKDSGDHPVDSARLYAALNAVEDPIDVLKKVDGGAYALVWYDKRDNSVNFARNGGRPMAFAETADYLYFGSEMGMLTWLMKRNHLAYRDFTIGELNTSTHYKIPLDNPEDVSMTPYEVERPKYVAPKVPAVPHQRPGSPPLSAGGGDGTPCRIGVRAIAHGSSVRNQQFWNLGDLVTDFPVVSPLADLIKECIWNEDGESQWARRCKALVLGCVDTGGVRRLYGLLMDRKGDSIVRDVYINMAATRSESTSKLVSTIPLLEAEEDFEYEDIAKTGFPLMDLHVDRVSIRPTGDIILEGRPVHKQEVKHWMEGVTESEYSWADFVTDPAFMNTHPEANLMQMWSDLRAGVVWSDHGPTKNDLLDDIPF